MRRCKKVLIDKNECDAVMNQILWNAVVLVQGLWLIENGERFSPKYDTVTGNSNNGWNHFLCFTCFGVDDFQSADKRKTSIYKCFEQNCLTDDANIIFLNVEIMTQRMNESTNAIACYSVIFWAKPLSVFNKPMTLNKDDHIPKYLICNRITF